MESREGVGIGQVSGREGRGGGAVGPPKTRKDVRQHGHSKSEKRREEERGAKEPTRVKRGRVKNR